VAVLDADFLPAADFLRRLLPWFADGRVGCVQSRWTHLNADYSLLTQAQALVLDGHFVIEQAACADNGLFMVFNGSGGVWRRAAIEAAGGWQSDTITEDMDLSYRAQLQGWRLVFVPQVTVPSELPAQLDAWKQQQFRWAKGSFQTLFKLTGRLLQARVSARIKIGAVIRMTGYVVQPLALAMMLLTPLMALLEVPTSAYLSIGLLAAIGPQALFVSAQVVQRHGRNRRLWALPVVYLIGVGTALSNTLAIWEALRGVPNVFERTPKFGVRSRRDRWTRSRYALGRSALAWAELGLSLYALVTLVLTVARGNLDFFPWLVIYILGFGSVATVSLWQDWTRRQPERLALDVEPSGAGEPVPERVVAR
jgi:cellulose synthase/poly-beta-1,6-N-acetylglucosamine synthase-like glycosyltransferase